MLPEEPFITPDNRVEFVSSCLELRCNEFDAQVAAVRAGIAEVLPGPLLSLLTATEFRDMVCGNADFDVSRLRSVARIDGYGASHIISSHGLDFSKWCQTNLDLRCGFHPAPCLVGAG